MKKFKIFLAAVICCLCLCTVFSGCGSSNAEYVENSYFYNSEYSENYLKQEVTVEMDFDIKKAGKYSVTFVLYGGYVSDVDYKWKEVCSKEITVKEIGIYDFSYFDWIFTDNDYPVTLKSLKIKEIKIKREYSSIAIVLGTSAALVTAVLVTLFVLQKKGKIK